MYTAFNLEISPNNFNNPAEYIEIGRQRRDHVRESLRPELEQFTSASGTIDGTALSDEWFKSVRSDVFISHSHNDEDLAFALAGWLKDQFNLNVFMDEFIWGSADKLLYAIDKDHSWSEKRGVFDYNTRNLTTSHVHAMLSTAIYSVMDEAEVILFLNTSESIPTIDKTLKENSEYTLSPWIYQELMATKLLRKRNWTEYRPGPIMEHSTFVKDSASLKIAYKTPLKDLTKIDCGTLCRWDENCGGRKAPQPWEILPNPFEHPLNYLYETVFGRQPD